jgi:dihydroxyacetone kinase
MKEIGVAQLGDRTMIDALKLALDELASGVVPAANAARKGAVHTSTIVKAKLGEHPISMQNSFTGI